MPGKPIQFLSVDEVLAIHERLIEVFGGPAGVRDMGMLESALFRPQTGYYQDIIQMSAALFESLLMNHCFVDGNKRTGTVASLIFLELNGYEFLSSEDELAEVVLDVASGTIDKAALAVFIRKWAKKKKC